MPRIALPALSSSLALSLLLFGAGCPPELGVDPPVSPEGTEAMLVSFDSCEQLEDRVVESWTETLVQARYGGWGWLEGDDDAVDAGGAPSNGEDGPTDWSETNVQEEGVDEPDLVKTDGEYIYVVEDHTLFIVDSWPAADAHEVARVTFDDDSRPFTMFLRGDRLAVFSYDYGAFDAEPYDWRGGYGTRVTVIDVEERDQPQVLREFTVEGWFANARMIGGDVYLVVNAWMGLPSELWDLLWNEQLALPEMDWEGSEEEQTEIRDEARELLAPYVEAAVAGLNSSELLPRITDSADGGAIEPLMGCTDLYRPNELSRASVLSVAHFDLDEGTAGGDVEATGLMADGWTVYASLDHLYVTQSSWWWWWGWGSMDMSTHIHKFQLDGGQPNYQASGSVPGWLLNQFSMSEYDDHLRVATTEFDWWWGTTEEEGGNNVFVLEQVGAGLEPIGALTNIAPGERITAARFQGEKAYLVTFLWIDPLFTIDLSNPYMPTLAGELEVTGFSSYIHPLGDDHLLTVGMEATEEGQITGLAISIFDVSDFADPQLAHRYVVESDDWSWSEALWNHHAFTFHRDVLAIPIYTWTGGDGFAGMLAVDVDPEAGLTELGRVSHEDMVSRSDCRYDYEEWNRPCQEYYWYAWMRRSVVIEDNLFSLSDYGIKVNELMTPENQLGEVLYWPL